MNRLYFGDNLKWLSDRKEFPDESVDLVYLDPPFNSNADYNVLFRESSGKVSQAQFHAFTDTWLAPLGSDLTIDTGRAVWRLAQCHDRCGFSTRELNIIS